MAAPHFKKQQKSLQKQFEQRRNLLEPLVKIYGKPVLVHSIHDISIFQKVIKEGKLKLPRKHTSPRKTPYMEKFLGIDNCIYYSLGFVYFSSYAWKYNLIFDLNQLKNLVYYNNSVNFQAARAVVNYWYENDREYLEKLANTNATTRAALDRYYHEEYNGKVRRVLEFWKIEKELFEYISKYPNKKKLMSIIKNIGKKHILKYPASEADALSCYLQEKAPEMVGKKENNLLKNKHFIGFFIEGKIDKKTLAILKEKYPAKILYDGVRVKKIADL